MYRDNEHIRIDLYKTMEELTEKIEQLSQVLTTEERIIEGHENRRNEVKERPERRKTNMSPVCQTLLNNKALQTHYEGISQLAILRRILNNYETYSAQILEPRGEGTEAGKDLMKRRKADNGFY